MGNHVNQQRKPLISVVMPVYNGERFLRDAVESILKQSFADFEYIIVDDGSTDQTSQILEEYRLLDSRIYIHANPTNKGIIKSLNTGCELSSGRYIARMDADDISLPNRLEKQLDYLEWHSEVGILGTSAEIIDKEGNAIGEVRLSDSPLETKWQMFFENRLMHPTVMMRRMVLEKVGFYRIDAIGAEDYDLWTRVGRTTCVSNLPEILLRYRRWDSSITSRLPNLVESRCIEIVRTHLCSTLNRDVSSETAATMRYLGGGDIRPQSIEQIENAERVLQALLDHFLELGVTDKVSLERVSEDAAFRFYRLAYVTISYSLYRAIRLAFKGVRCSPNSIVPVMLKILKRLWRSGRP